MSDDLEQAMTDTESVSVGTLREVLAEALAPIHERLGRIEREFDEFRRETRDSLTTMRSEGLDMRAAVDGLKAEVRELRYARSAVPAE